MYVGSLSSPEERMWEGKIRMCKNLRRKEDIKALAEGTKELPCEPGVCDLYMGDDGLSEPTAEDWTIARERGLAEGRTRGTEVVPIYGLADAPLRVAIVGGHGSGKSAVVHSFLDGTFWQGGVDHHELANEHTVKGRITTRVFRNRILELHLCDSRYRDGSSWSVSGSPMLSEESFLKRPALPEEIASQGYYPAGGPINQQLADARLVLLTVNITDKSSLRTAEMFLERIELGQKSLDSHSDSYVHVEAVNLLLGTKADLEEKRQISRAHAEAWAVAQNLRYIETSAKTGQGAAHAISTGVQLVHGRRGIFEKFEQDLHVGKLAGEAATRRQAANRNRGGIHSMMGCTVS